MEKMKNSTIQLIANPPIHVQTRLTHGFKAEIERRTKRLFINKEFIEYIQQTIAKLPQRDKIACLHYFKKLAVQVKRSPDPDHFKAFEDEYTEFLSEIAGDQKFYEPVKWINAEIEYLMNSTERLTTEDVNHRLDVMIEAKQKLSKDLLTGDEVMKLLGISKSTLNRRRSEGMPCYKKGKLIHYDLREITNWLKEEAA